MRSSKQRLLAAFGAVALFAAAAPAADAMSVSIGKPAMIGRVAINVPVSVTCSPFEPGLTQYLDYVTATVRQASGRSIAAATGFASSGLGALLFPCDGTPHGTTVPVGTSSGPPFHGGSAVFNVTATANAGVPCFPGTTTCFSGLVSQSASAGPVEIHL